MWEKKKPGDYLQNRILLPDDHCRNYTLQ